MVDLNKSGVIEKLYQKKSQLEHILLRPDSYVGSIKKEESLMWIYDAETDSMIEKTVTYNPALYKIFDEILVNASDNKIADKSMSCIRIKIDSENNKIKIWNNGKGIPVTIHKTENIYVPTMIFGHLLTSTNFDDTEKKVTGGRNGYGAKLCNIFSTEFTVETSSSKFKKCFKQTWKNNMGIAGEPIIDKATTEDYTCVSFCPDLEKFGMTHLDKDIVGLFCRRAYDIAACTSGVSVYLNNKLVPVKNFKDYVDMYTKNIEEINGEPLKVVYEKYSDRWEVAVTTSVNDTFNQLSFVNSIATTKGGTHVNYVTDQIATKLLEIAKKKLKTDKQAFKLKTNQVKMNLWVFVRCLIENPTFDSQTKENMTLNSKDFGSTCIISEKFVNQATKTGIMDKLNQWSDMKNKALMDKKCSKTKQSKLKNIPKLDDANMAGGKNSMQCTLILTEGDSAKTLAISGLSVVGKDYYGIFPLRGKLLNVREANTKQLAENAEITNLIKILGLRYTEKYIEPESLKTLRYGKILIMTDQDQDGSHIKGLVINFIHTNWPNLLKHNFIEEFITPIVKAIKKDEVLSFYSLPELYEWMKKTPDHKRYSIKYYKGLGTSTSKEAKEYFSDMVRHLIKFRYQGMTDDKSIVLAFGKNKADHRKLWLTEHMERAKTRRELGQDEEFLYGVGTKTITFDDFINKELILFSNLDNTRSIPNLIDGLKPGQRKVLFTCLKRNLKKELKVAQLSGSVAEISAYHHGEASLMGTIINLAQDYVGSNNINLLMPCGQFGTRLSGGKDSASPRYIFTHLNPLTRLIFHENDDPIYKYEYEDNQRIEPEWYCPIIPMVLVNGADGIGTGWSTKIPNYNPRDLIANIRRMIDGEEPKKMHPWFRGFRGTIVETSDNRYVVSGEIGLLDSNCLEITELPIRVWTQKYKEDVMEVFLNGSDKIPSVITDYKDHNTDTTVRIVVEMSQQKFQEAQETGFHKFFKVQSVMNCTNMVLFDNFGVIRQFESAEEILKVFYQVRLEMYCRRKDYLIGMLSAEASKLQNQAKFILEKIEGKIIIENRKRKVIIEMLKQRGYDSDPIKVWKKNRERLEEILAEEMNKDNDGEDEDDNEGPDYTYLTGMPIMHLSEEKKDALLAERDKKLKELSDMHKKTPQQLWLDDLNALEKGLDESDQIDKTNAADMIKGMVASTGSAKGKQRKGKSVKIAAETAPSKFATRVVPTINDEDAKKITADKQKKKQKKMMEEFVSSGKTRVSVGSMGDTNTKNEDRPMTLAEKLQAEGLDTVGISSMKPTKKASVKRVNSAMSGGSTKPKRKKKDLFDSDIEEVGDLSDIEESDINAPDDEIIPKRDKPSRAAAKIAKYKLSDDEVEEMDDDIKAESTGGSEFKFSNKPSTISDNDDPEFDPMEEKVIEKKAPTPVKKTMVQLKPSVSSAKKPVAKSNSQKSAKPTVERKKPITKKPSTATKKNTKNIKDFFKTEGSIPEVKEDSIPETKEDDIFSPIKEKPTRTKRDNKNKYVFSSDEEDADIFNKNSDDSDFDISVEKKKSKPKTKKPKMIDSDSD